MIRHRHALVSLLGSLLILTQGAGATILEGAAACLCLLGATEVRAETEAETAREENWQRLCVLGFTTVVERVLAHLPLTLAPGAQDKAGGRGPALWVKREDQDLVITIDESRGKGQASIDSTDDAVLVDHDGDGTIDRIVDWVDLDRDGRADRQVLYAVTPGVWHPTRMAALLIEQRDRERGFWHLVRHQYIQNLCQWRCDFSGDGFFTAASYDEATRRWTAFDEDPFCFYDDDDDGWNDEALRLARAVGVDLDKDIIGWLADRKGSDVRLWDSGTRAAKGALGAADGSRAMIDVIHHAAYSARKRNLEAARELLAKNHVDSDPRFFASLEAVLEVLPVSKAFSGIELEGEVAAQGSDFEVLENLRRLAFSDHVDEPKQLDLWREDTAA